MHAEVLLVFSLQSAGLYAMLSTCACCSMQQCVHCEWCRAAHEYAEHGHPSGKVVLTVAA